MKSVLSLTVLACLFFVFSSCTRAEKSSPVSLTHKNSASIINGDIVSEDNEMGKSTVGLLIEINGTWYQACTGSIIAPNMILTAAHCLSFANEARDNLVINFSLNTVSDAQGDENDPNSIQDVRKEFRTVDVLDLIMHPDYDGSVDHDVAVIRLKKDIPDTHRAVEFLPNPIMDANGKLLELEGETKDVTLLGFGLISEESGESSTSLRMTTVPAKFEGAILVTDQTLGTGACNGDSGGPAFIKMGDKNYLVGVTHGPYKDFQTCHDFGAYLNPNLFLNFIEHSMKNLNDIAL